MSTKSPAKSGKAVVKKATSTVLPVKAKPQKKIPTNPPGAPGGDHSRHAVEIGYRIRGGVDWKIIVPGSTTPTQPGPPRPIVIPAGLWDHHVVEVPGGKELHLVIGTAGKS